MRTSKLLDKDEIQTSRQVNLDLLKALAIIAMIICHPVIQFALHHPGYQQDIPYLIGDHFFGSYLAVAHAFMFAMGFGVVYSRRNAPLDLVRRGIRLLVLGYILNFFRYGIYALADGLIEGEFLAETVYSLVVQDILHFAGLALIATGIFKRLKMNEFQILGIGVVLSALGGFLAFAYQGSSVANYFLGFFVVTTEDDSCFAFLNWYLFVAVGIVFGTIVRGTENLDRLYGRLLCVALPVMLLYLVLTAVFGAFFMTKGGWCYATSFPESIGLLSIDLTLLSAFHFLAKRVNSSRLTPFITMSRNVTQIYCIHWCIIGFVDSIFCYLLGVVFSYTFMYLFGVALIFVSYWVAKWWMGRKQPG